MRYVNRFSGDISSRTSLAARKYPHEKENLDWIQKKIKTFY